MKPLRVSYDIDPEVAATNCHLEAFTAQNPIEVLCHLGHAPHVADLDTGDTTGFVDLFNGSDEPYDPTLDDEYLTIAQLMRKYGLSEEQILQAGMSDETSFTEALERLKESITVPQPTTASANRNDHAAIVRIQDMDDDTFGHVYDLAEAERDAKVVQTTLNVLMESPVAPHETHTFPRYRFRVSPWLLHCRDRAKNDLRKGRIDDVRTSQSGYANFVRSSRYATPKAWKTDKPKIHRGRGNFVRNSRYATPKAWKTDKSWIHRGRCSLNCPCSVEVTEYKWTITDALADELAELMDMLIMDDEAA